MHDISMVEMLEIIAKELDTNGKYTSDISSIMSSYRLNNYSCSGAPQQVANGTYRTVELLEIIAKEVDAKGKYTSDISSVMSSYRLNNYSCDSAVQQAVNGTYRTVELLEIIAKCFADNAGRI